MTAVVAASVSDPTTATPRRAAANSKAIVHRPVVRTPTKRQPAPERLSDIFPPLPPPTPLAATERRVSDDEIAAACPVYGLIEEWRPSYDRKMKWPHRYLATFDALFQPLFDKAAAADFLPLSTGYRTCLERAGQAVRSSPNYVITGQQHQWCAECKILLSPLAGQVPRMKILEGLTYLTSPDITQQDWSKAATTIRDGILAMQTVQNDFATQADAAYSAKGDYARRAASTSGWATVIGSVAGGLISGNMAAANNYAQQKLGQIDSERRQAVGAIASHQRELFDLPTVGGWGDDGVRVTVPMLQMWASSGQALSAKAEYFPTGAVWRRFPLSRIVKVTTAFGGYCTGSFVGNRIILTNRHCVMNDSGEVRTPPRAAYAYYRNAGEEFRRYEATFHVTNAIYPRGDHRVDHKYDWALLETAEASSNGYLGFRDPAEITQLSTARVAVAGYSGDLNQGAEITMDWGCRVALRSGTLLHLCRTWRGASGSPVVLIDRDGLRGTVIGVHAAGPIGRTTSGMRFAAADPGLFASLSELRAKHDAQAASPR